MRRPALRSLRRLGPVLRWLRKEWRIPLGRVLSLVSAQPAALLNLKGRGTLTVGSFADVVVFDPKAEWIYNARETKSKSRNTHLRRLDHAGQGLAGRSARGESLIHIPRKDSSSKA